MIKKTFACILATSLLLVGCGQKTADTKSSSEDTSWLKASIEEVNKDADKKIIQTIVNENKSGEKVNLVTEYAINKDASIINMKSEDPKDKNNKLDIFYNVKSDKVDMYNYNVETKKYDVQKDTPLNKEQIDSMISRAKMDTDINKYEVLGKEKIDGKEVIKVVYHKTVDSSLAEDLKNAGTLTDEMIKKNPDLKKAVDEDLKKKAAITYFFDQQSKKLMYYESDVTAFTVINHYTNGEGGEAPVKSIMKTEIKTKDIGKIELPK